MAKLRVHQKLFKSEAELVSDSDHVTTSSSSSSSDEGTAVMLSCLVCHTG